MTEEKNKIEVDWGSYYLHTFWNWLKKNATIKNLALLLGIGVIALAITLTFAPVVYLLTAEYTETRQASEALRNILLGAAAAIGGPFGFWLAWKRTNALQKDADTKERTHYTDLFSRAVEQLTSDKLGERLGGIYTLEKISTDNLDFNTQSAQIIQKMAGDKKESHEIIAMLHSLSNICKFYIMKKGRKISYPISGISLNMINVYGREFHHISITNSKIEKCSFTNCEFHETIIKQNDISELKFKKCTLKHVTYTDNNSKGIIFIDCSIDSKYVKTKETNDIKYIRCIINGKFRDDSSK